jgi:hypothetical protein
MEILLRSGLRHPLFASWKTTAAMKAAGVCVAVTGTFNELAQAAGRGVIATHAVFPLLQVGSPPLTGAERDRLWELWQVPVYAIVQDAAGRVVAYECETCEGMHLSDWVPPTGTVESAPCECGCPTPRWIPASNQPSSAA